MQLFLDMDGVLADFDKRATEILGMAPSRYEARFGARSFWAVLQGTPDFYNSFDPMIDAPFLVEATQHLQPIVLTGVPLGEWAAPQKRAWIRRMFPTLNFIITCRSKDKSKYCRPGDVLVDDRVEYRPLWEAAGGTYVVHTSAFQSLAELRALGVI